MRPTRKLIVATAVTALVLAGAGAAYAASGDDDGEGRATGPGADRARTAALALVEGGTVNAVERDDEKGATWEVEITKPDGRTVDVRLDAAYRLVVIDGDNESPDDR